MNRVYYFATWISYYWGSAATLFALLCLTLTGLLFPKVGVLWQVFFVYVGSEIFLFGVQDIFGQDAMLYYAMSHSSWQDSDCDQDVASQQACIDKVTDERDLITF